MSYNHTRNILVSYNMSKTVIYQRQFYVYNSEVFLGSQLATNQMNFFHNMSENMFLLFNIVTKFYERDV